MERSRERPVIQAALTGSALMVLWMGRRIAPGELPLTGDLLRSYYPFGRGRRLAASFIEAQDIGTNRPTAASSVTPAFI
jgi:hypothetical protein